MQIALLGDSDIAISLCSRTLVKRIEKLVRQHIVILRRAVISIRDRRCHLYRIGKLIFRAAPYSRVAQRQFRLCNRSRIIRGHSQCDVVEEHSRKSAVTHLRSYVCATRCRIISTKPDRNPGVVRSGSTVHKIEYLRIGSSCPRLLVDVTFRSICYGLRTEV